MNTNSKYEKFIQAKTAWFENLVANNAFLDNLFSNKIILGNKNKDDLVLDNCYIQSKNFEHNKAGFRIAANGDAEFVGIQSEKAVINNSSATFLYVFNGVFDKSCVFKGDILSNNIISLNENPVSQQITIPAKTILTDFELGPANGLYDGIEWTYVKCIKSSEKISSAFSVITMYHAKLYLYDENKKEKKMYDYKCPDLDEVLLPKDIVYTPIFEENTKTLKLINLPTSKPKEKGIVYRDGDFLKIS